MKLYFILALLLTNSVFADDTILNKKNLHDVYKKYSGPDGSGDKGTAHSYIDVYNKKINQPQCSLLEIGIYEGLSLLMWKDYLPNANIFGVDITDQFIMHDLSSCNVIIDDATSIGFSHRFDDHSLDYIIDDGSHSLLDQLNSLAYLFQKLKSGGIYFIEDVPIQNISTLLEHLSSCKYNYEVHMGNIATRFDDILVIIYAP